MINKIGIIGIGGVGGYFGGKLCAALGNEAEFYFVARGKHLEVIKNEGLTLKTSDEGEFKCKPTLATDTIADLPELDLCIICVKSFDLSPVLQELKGKISSKTIVLPLLNGVDIYYRVKKHFHTAVVLPATVYVGTHIEKPGLVSQSGGACTILFGTDPGHREFTPETLTVFLDKGKVKYTCYEDVFPQIWQKFIFIAAFGMVTAVSDNPLGAVMESEELSAQVRSIMGEIFSLGIKLGIKLPKDIIETSFNKGHNFPYEVKTSFQRDFEKKDKSDERELFGGTIIRLCEREGLPCDTTKAVYERLNELK